MKLVGARRLARPRLPDSESGGSAVPREPRADKMASLTGFAPVISCMRGRHVGWTTPQGLVKRPNPKIQIPKKLLIPISKARNSWLPHVLLTAALDWPFEIWSLGFVWSLEFGCWSFRNGVPSRTFTSNLTLRTRLLYELSYGDENWYARPVTLRIPALI